MIRLCHLSGQTPQWLSNSFRIKSKVLTMIYRFHWVLASIGSDFIISLSSTDLLSFISGFLLCAPNEGFLSLGTISLCFDMEKLSCTIGCLETSLAYTREMAVTSPHCDNKNIFKHCQSPLGMEVQKWTLGENHCSTSMLLPQDLCVFCCLCLLPDTTGLIPSLGQVSASTTILT